jgi:hypothetical protein
MAAGNGVNMVNLGQQRLHLQFECVPAECGAQDSDSRHSTSAADDGVNVLNLDSSAFTCEKCVSAECGVQDGGSRQ